MSQPTEYELARVRGMIFAFVLMTGVLRVVTAALDLALRFLPSPNKKDQ